MWIEWSNKINILNKALDGYWLRNKTINQNISNANTPNYKRLTVKFEDELRDAMAIRKHRLSRTHRKHIPVSGAIDKVQPRVEEKKHYSYRFDRNNVNIDTESADLAKNTIMYNALVNQTIGEFEKIKNVINEVNK
ncbi:MAG: flagellar basal body rod protein FlgB [Tissierellia bacterium]|nr:flagellar basal body rod protein FlgB [Tissierellia bacterium]